MLLVLVSFRGLILIFQQASPSCLHGRTLKGGGLATPSRKLLVQSTLPIPCYNGRPIIWTAAKSKARINYRRLTEINSHYYGLLLMRTLTSGPTVSTIKRVDCTHRRDKYTCTGAVQWSKLSCPKKQHDARVVPGQTELKFRGVNHLATNQNSVQSQQISWAKCHIFLSCMLFMSGCSVSCPGIKNQKLINYCMNANCTLQKLDPFV